MERERQTRCVKLSVGVRVRRRPQPQERARSVARLDVLVATPGRLLDLVDQRALELARPRGAGPRRGRPDARPRLHPRVQADRRVGPAQAPDPVLLGHHAAGNQGTGRPLSHQPGRSLGGSDRDHRRARRAARDHGQPGRKAGAAHPLSPDAMRSSGRWSSAAPSMAPTRSSACSPRPASTPTRSTATSRSRSASARLRVQVGPDQGAGRDRHRGARDRHPGRQPRRQFRPARRSRAICPPHRPHRARRRRRASRSLSAPHDERGNLRDIERTTRQKLDRDAAARQASPPRREALKALQAGARGQRASSAGSVIARAPSRPRTASAAGEPRQRSGAAARAATAPDRSHRSQRATRAASPGAAARPSAGRRRRARTVPRSASAAAVPAAPSARG